MSMRMRSCDPPSCRTCRGERLSSLGTFALHVRHSLTPFTQPRISPVIHRGETLAGTTAARLSISTISGHIWICIPVSRSSVLNSVFAENDCQNPPRPSRLYSTELATGTRHAAYRARRICSVSRAPDADVHADVGGPPPSRSLERDACPRCARCQGATFGFINTTVPDAGFPRGFARILTLVTWPSTLIATALLG